MWQIFDEPMNLAQSPGFYKIEFHVDLEVVVNTLSDKVELW